MSRPSYLWHGNGNPHTWERWSLYWDKAWSELSDVQCDLWVPGPCLTTAIWRCRKPFRPIANQLSKKAALPLAKILTTLSCRSSKTTQIAKFVWPTWGPPGSYRLQMGPMMAPCYQRRPCPTVPGPLWVPAVYWSLCGRLSPVSPPVWWLWWPPVSQYALSWPLCTTHCSVQPPIQDYWQGLTQASWPLHLHTPPRDSEVGCITVTAVLNVIKQCIDWYLSPERATCVCFVY